jgi:hypothetical protein
MPSSPPPDRFQREIDDIIRLAERRLEHQSFSYRMRRSTRRLGNAMGGFAIHLPAPETLGGWGLALLLISSLFTLPIIGGILRPLSVLQPFILTAGIILLVIALISSLMRGRGSGNKMWRGERIAYGNAYGSGIMGRLRRLFRGGR